MVRTVANSSNNGVRVTINDKRVEKGHSFYRCPVPHDSETECVRIPGCHLVVCLLVALRIDVEEIPPDVVAIGTLVGLSNLSRALQQLQKMIRFHNVIRNIMGMEKIGNRRGEQRMIDGAKVRINGCRPLHCGSDVWLRGGSPPPHRWP